MQLKYFRNHDGPEDPEWWKTGTVYQIYPSSFKDSNGDGIGDIPGIISKLDYLTTLGVDIIWLSPHYKSPQVDMGYDISDYKDIHDKYGTLAQCEQLIRECHARGLKLIFDLVVNHTSDQHEWFKESRSSKTNPKRDWYIWRPARYDDKGVRHPPNNWASYFSGSAWQWDELTQEYYLHLFAVEQPDINWRNLETRKAVYHDAITYWLDKGIDGFRIDTVEIYSKPEDLHDAPIQDPNAEFQYAAPVVREGPQLHEILREMNEVGFHKCMTVGEGAPDTYEEALTMVGASRKEINMAFTFETVSLGKNNVLHRMEPFSVKDIRRTIEKWQRFIIGTDGWTTAHLENHDVGRSVTRFGNDSKEHRVNSAKMLAVMLSTMSGTLFLYQGQEIGSINVPEDWPINKFQDVEAINAYKEELHKADSQRSVSKLMEYLHYTGRDNARTPMQWDSTAHAGFTDGSRPWMSVNPSYKEINVASQLYDPYSTFSFWKTALLFRQAHPSLTALGDFEVVDRDNEHVLAYTKSEHGVKDGKKLLVALNFSDKPRKFKFEGSLLLSSNPSHVNGLLQAYEGAVYSL